MSPRPLPLQTTTVSGWRGMWYSRWPHDGADDFAYFVKNGALANDEEKAGYVQRPAYRRQNSSAAGGASPTAQLVYDFVKTDGTRYAIVICGGVFYTASLGTDSAALSEAVNAATFSGAGVTLSATARCYAATLGNTVVISDGTNTPFSWDGTTNGGVTKLTNCPVIYGQPTVYYGKLFVIKNAERHTIAWSEENDPTTGYEAGGYNNAWTLSQSDIGPLFAIRGTNDALFYWRRDSYGKIQGAVNDTFTTSGVHDAGSSTIGTVHPDGVLVLGGDIWFADQYGRPWYIPRGGQLDPVWRWIGDAFAAAADQTADNAINASGLYSFVNGSTSFPLWVNEIPGTTLVVFQDFNGHQWAFDRERRVAAGFWQSVTSNRDGGCAGVLYNSALDRQDLYVLETDGFLYWNAPVLKASYLKDKNAAGTESSVNVELYGRHIGNEINPTLYFDRMDVAVDVRSGGSTSVIAEVLTPLSQTPVSSSVNATTGATLVATRVSVGLKRHGRWGVPYALATSTLGSGIHGYTVWWYLWEVAP